jgi:degradative hydroxymethylglutaryl-CoA reductase
MAVIELLVNVCDSMGANVINSVCEATAPFIQ